MAQRCTLCYHCGVESAANVFKYYNNGKQTQPRYQCGSCQKFFTMGSHGRKQGRTYAKQRNVDPPELRGLPRECRCCGAKDNAVFKYYNNSNLSQPRFKCLSCGQQFQMRLMGVGEARRLVHVSSYQRPSTSDRRKLDLAPTSKDADDVSRPMQAATVDPCMPALELGVELVPPALKNEKEAPPTSGSAEAPIVILKVVLKLPSQDHAVESHS